jgi:hypothetical protein
MKLPSSVWVIGLFALVVGPARASDDLLVLPISLPQSASSIANRGLGAQAQAPQPAQQAQPPAETQPPAQEDFVQAPTATGEAGRGLNPNMIGDFPGTFVFRTIPVPSVQLTTITLKIPTGALDAAGKPIIVFRTVTVGTVQTPITVTQTTRVLAGASGLGFKIADNQSPQPSDRFFFSYNFFGSIQGPSGPSATQSVVPVSTTTVPFNNNSGVNLPVGTTQTTTVNNIVPGIAAPRQYLNGGIIGFEKAFFDGQASVGMRAPFYSQQGDGSFNQQDFGNLAAFFNYAFYLDRTTGNVLSTGLMVTLPTGPAVNTAVGNVNSTALQPFLGYRWNLKDFYVIGFTSLAVPTTASDVTYFFNDIGVGYWIYRGSPDRWITGIAPTVETHISTPLNHRQITDTVSGFNEVDMTAGINIALRRNSILTFGVATPVTGPRPFGIEAIAQFNFRF